MARDPLELRKHVPTVPADANDPPRFGQLVETTKDAFVLELRKYLSGPDVQALPGRQSELPTISKYDTNFGDNLDPYATFVKITEDFPDVLQRLPHISVTTASLTNQRMTFGRPHIANTQLPPRVETTLPGPYALASATAQVSTIVVATLPVGTTLYTVLVNSVPFTVEVAGSANATTILRALASLIRSEVDLFLAVSTTATTLTIRAREVGVPFTLDASINLTAATVTPAGAATPDVLVYRTHPPVSGGVGVVTPGVVVQSQVVFEASRFADVTAATAADVARVFNEQAAYAQAKVIEVGAGSGVRFEVGGPKGAGCPNLIEVMPGTTANVLALLGLGGAGTVGVGATLTGLAPTLVLTVGAPLFDAGMVGRYVTLEGIDNANDGHFLITAATPTTLTFTNPDGVSGATVDSDVTWFVGLYDDSRNPLRPVQNRFHMSAAAVVNIDVWAESPNVRREVADLVYSYFTFFMELKHFTMYGRGVFDELYPDEHYQISLSQEVSLPSEQDFPRGEDQKNRVWASRIVAPVRATHYLDREVTVATGPSEGLTWQLVPGDVLASDDLIEPN